MDAQQDFRALFLEEFVKRMIVRALPKTPQVGKRDGLISKLDKVSAAPPVLKIKTRVEETPPHLTKEFLAPEEKPKEQKLEAKAEQFRQIAVVKTLPALPPILPAISPKAIELPALPPIKPAISAPKTVEITALPAIPKPKISIMEKLNPLILDPSVQAINCPGAGKNVTVARFGAIQSTSLVFSANDIRDFLKEISERTRIPMLPGIFKVTYQNFILTAVVSEFAETKFMIEKKPAVLAPFQGRAPQQVRFR